MKNKDFAEYPEALELRELGFDEPCFGYYVDGELRGIDLGMEELGGVKPYYQRFGFHVLNNHDIDNPNKVVVTAPTYSQAFRWFRDKYYLTWEHQFDDGNICLFVGEITYPDTSLRFFRAVEVKQDGYNEAYEEAELACLKKLIEIVKDEK